MYAIQEIKEILTHGYKIRIQEQLCDCPCICVSYIGLFSGLYPSSCLHITTTKRIS